MNRRGFIASSIGIASLLPARIAAGASATKPGKAQAIQLNVNTARVLGGIPQEFMGLGYEISSVATPGLLSAQNRTYVQLVKTLGTHGVIRVGGNTSDYSSFSPRKRAVAAPKETVVNETNLRDLGSFLDATGWKLIWGLNLGDGSEQNAVVEAQAVAAVAKEKLLAFEIGNEPDLFGHGAAHRPKSYSYDDYLREYRRYKAAIRAKLPEAPFAGPDAASATDWVTRFAADEGNDLRLLTHHYYRQCAGPTSTLEKLLQPDPKLAPELKKLRAASASSHLPYRICETNSFCGGGQPGVSDTFGSALWVLDYMFTLAWAGAAGVNIETGVNQLGFVSSYSPIVGEGNGDYSARPDYYGMLAFAQAGRGQKVSTDYDASGVNVTAYSVLQDGHRIAVTIINKEESHDVNVSVTADRQFRQASALRLNAPSLQAKNGVKFGGSSVTTGGKWEPAQVEQLKLSGRGCKVAVGAGSAVIVTLTS